jgi:hypothetical protein
MSDVTAFLGGAALAGLAALIVVRGGINLDAPTVSSPATVAVPQAPLPGGANLSSGLVSSPLPPPAIGSQQSAEQRDYEAAKLRLEVDQLKAQLEQQQSQMRGQQATLDTLVAQAKTGVLTPLPPSPAIVPQVIPPPTAAASADTSLLSGLPWALGGILLTFGGGIALVGMFTMFARQSRPNRSIEYIQDDYPAYLANARRRVQVLPPRRPIRRIDVEDED